MMDPTLGAAISTAGGMVLVALINVLPNLKTGKKISRLVEDVDELKTYIIAEKNVEQIRKKFQDVQSYFVNKIDEEYKDIAIKKSNKFMDLVIDFGMGLDLDNLNDYQCFQDQLISASHDNERNMKLMLGSEVTDKYYATHKGNLLRYNNIIQKIFMTTENSKKQKFISASIDFMQLFMTEMVCLKNGKKKDLLDENCQKARRKEDHK